MKTDMLAETALSGFSDFRKIIDFRFLMKFLGILNIFRLHRNPPETDGKRFIFTFATRDECIPFIRVTGATNSPSVLNAGTIFSTQKNFRIRRRKWRTYLIRQK